MRFLLLSFIATLATSYAISRTGGFAHAQSDPTNPTNPTADSSVADASVERELTPLEKEMLQKTDKLVTAFNNGDIKAIVDTFLPEGELIDEQGVVHSGQEQISALMNSFFEKYPNVSTEAELESVRQVAGIVFADGRRSIATADGTNVTLLRFNSVWQKTDAGFKLASFRDYSEPSGLTPSEALQELQWLIGDWVNEGDDATVRLSFKWSADANFILGDYSLKTVDGELSTSIQRIGWDASQGAFRSWTFDVDGGFGEGTWTRIENGWRVRSSAVTPEGTTASAILLLTPVSEDRFSINGSNRIANEESLPDYEIFVVKRPPPAMKK